jgi:hypothetical protein
VDEVRRKLRIIEVTLDPEESNLSHKPIEFRLRGPYADDSAPIAVSWIEFYLEPETFRPGSRDACKMLPGFEPLTPFVWPDPIRSNHQGGS